MKRDDDFKQRRKHLESLTEEELEGRFWQLAEELVDPIIELSKENTSPSIERSVLLRMGFSSIEAKSIVNGAIERDLIGKGAGHIVYRLAKDSNMEISQVGQKLAEGEMWEEAIETFKGGVN